VRVVLNFVNLDKPEQYLHFYFTLFYEAYNHRNLDLQELHEIYLI
jgi:hypothetical protein